MTLIITLMPTAPHREEDTFPTAEGYARRPGCVCSWLINKHTARLSTRLCLLLADQQTHSSSVNQTVFVGG